MRRTLLWSLILLITFALGIATAFLRLNRFEQSNAKPETVYLPSQKSDIPAEQQILAYCELANNPEKYDGKVVRVSARLWFMIHGHSFTDKNCDGETKQAAVIFPEGERGFEMFNKIAKDTGLAEYNPWDFPEIIAVGKFSRVEPTGKSDSMENNTYLHFEILDVEKASKY